MQQFFQLLCWKHLTNGSESRHVSKWKIWTVLLRVTCHIAPWMVHIILGGITVHIYWNRPVHFHFSLISYGTDKSFSPNVHLIHTYLSINICYNAWQNISHLVFFDLQYHCSATSVSNLHDYSVHRTAKCLHDEFFGRLITSISMNLSI